MVSRLLHRSIVTIPWRGRLGLGILTVGLALGLYTASARAPSTPPVLVADRLFFGRAIPGGGFVSEEEWAMFLHDVVTPRFPEGLTIWRAYGQWTDSRGQLIRESVLVLEVLHPPGPRVDSSLAAIARQYKGRFHQGSVLRVSTPAVGHFYE